MFTMLPDVPLRRLQLERFFSCQSSLDQLAGRQIDILHYAHWHTNNVELQRLKSVKVKFLHMPPRSGHPLPPNELLSCLPPTLLALNLDHCDLFTTEPFRTCGLELPELRALGLMANPRTLAPHLSTLSGLRQFPQLRWLNLSRYTTVIDWTGLEALTQLEMLYLDGNRSVTDTVLATIGRLVNLRVLALSQTRVTDDGLSHLLGLPLSMIQLPNISAAGLRNLAQLQLPLEHVQWSRDDVDELEPGLAPPTHGNGLRRFEFDDFMAFCDQTRLREVSSLRHFWSRDQRRVLRERNLAVVEPFNPWPWGAQETINHEEEICQLLDL